MLLWIVSTCFVYQLLALGHVEGNQHMRDEQITHSIRCSSFVSCFPSSMGLKGRGNFRESPKRSSHSLDHGKSGKGVGTWKSPWDIKHHMEDGPVRMWSVWRVGTWGVGSCCYNREAPVWQQCHHVFWCLLRDGNFTRRLHEKNSRWDIVDGTFLRHALRTRM